MPKRIIKFIEIVLPFLHTIQLFLKRFQYEVFANILTFGWGFWLVTHGDAVYSTPSYAVLKKIAHAEILGVIMMVIGAVSIWFMLSFKKQVVARFALVLGLVFAFIAIGFYTATMTSTAVITYSTISVFNFLIWFKYLDLLCLLKKLSKLLAL